MNYPKTIVFCPTYSDCSMLHRLVHHYLGESVTHLPKYPDFQQFRVLDTCMYTKVSTPEMKEKVLPFFSAPNSRLRLVVATTTFGKGIDSPDIRRVIHYGPPGDVKLYVQESGRAGHDGL